uniref:Uncharacterized protein n=1 Tax=Ascaris lumbricoides TaxID=6252 RepID=A0A0M3IJ86_ASCLU
MVSERLQQWLEKDNSAHCPEILGAQVPSFLKNCFISKHMHFRAIFSFHTCALKIVQIALYFLLHIFANCKLHVHYTCFLLHTFLCTEMIGTFSAFNAERGEGEGEGKRCVKASQL